MAAISGMAVAHTSQSARGAGVATWHLAYPQTMSYRTLGADRSIKCDQPDSVFDGQVAAEGLDGYEIYDVAGERGSCARLKAEQLKRLHPEKLLIAYENATAGAPSTWAGDTWPGYYLMMNRTTALASVDATQTRISVADPSFFSVGDTAAMWSPTPTDYYANSEWVTVTAVGTTSIAVRRNIFGTGAQSYASPPLLAAAATGAGYPWPMYNFADVAPVNPATGQRANQWLVTALVNDFAPSMPTGTTLDAMELDSAASTPPANNTNGSTKNFDCNGDGIIDYCQENAGTTQQVDAYGVGYDQFLQSLKAGLAVYDTDATRPAKMLLADAESGLRSIGALNGAEFESYPTWDDYTYSSPAFMNLGVWQKRAGATGDHLSYAFTKDATPNYPQMGCVTPANGGTCRNANYRYGMVSALLLGGASAYNNEASFLYPQQWDEEATINQATTGLVPGYLGQPLAAATRQRRYTSGELAVNGDFEATAPIAAASTFVAGVTTARDTVKPAPGHGVASLRVDVTQTSAQPSPSDVRFTVPLSAPVTPGEYTVDFYARAENTASGPQALNFGVGLAGAPGKPQSVLLTSGWKHFILQFNATTSSLKPVVRFAMGAQIGTYWIDGVTVHQGSAGVMLRQFQNGIVVLNDSFSAQDDIALPHGPYHHINGVQDRSVNDGSTVGSVLPELGAKDGVILLRG